MSWIFHIKEKIFFYYWIRILFLSVVITPLLKINVNFWYCLLSAIICSILAFLLHNFLNLDVSKFLRSTKETIKSCNSQEIKNLYKTFINTNLEGLKNNDKKILNELKSILENEIDRREIILEGDDYNE